MGKPKFVVVEDNPVHLATLTGGLAKTGKASLSIQVDGAFDPETALTVVNARRVRVLFSDLHLVGMQAGSDPNAHYAVIAAFILNSRPGGGGPWLLVMWTENVEEAAGLEDYLKGSLDVGLLPVAVIPLSKDKYLLAAEKLPAAIDDLLSKYPSVRALLDWEDTLADAAADTISTLADAARNHEEKAGVKNGVGRLLGFISKAAFGQRAEKDQFGAVATGLAPLVADRVINADRGKKAVDLWEKAIVMPTTHKLSPEVRARLNAMLHIDTRHPSVLQPGHIGTFCEIPATWHGEVKFRQLFGDVATMKAQYKIATGHFPELKWGVIGFRAPCDDAHGKPGPLPFALAVEGLNANWFKGGAGETVKENFSEAIWFSPLYFREDQVRRLIVSASYVTYLPEARAKKLKPSFRLRDQLLAELTSKIHVHGSRAAILSF